MKILCHIGKRCSPLCFFSKKGNSNDSSYLVPTIFFRSICELLVFHVFFFFFHFNPHRCSFTDSTSIFLEFKQCVIQVAGGWTRIRILVFLTTMLYYLAIMIIITFWRSRHCGILETWWDLESWRWRTWLCFSLMVYRLIYSYITMLVWSSLIVMWSWASK